MVLCEGNAPACTISRVNSLALCTWLGPSPSAAAAAGQLHPASLGPQHPFLPLLHGARDSCMHACLLVTCGAVAPGAVAQL